MSFKYNPKDAVSCLPEGDYHATIEKAEETTSKAGNPMLVITFKAYGPRGNTYELKDYIVTEMSWKLKRIAQAVGSEAAFLKGEFFANDYVGKNLQLTLSVEETTDYGDQNRIKAYKPMPLTGTPAATALATGSMSDESIPF